MQYFLTALPIELLLSIVSHLSLEDFVNLRKADKRVANLITNEITCHELIKRYISYSKEARPPLAKGDYQAIIERVSNRRAAFAKAEPRSALILAKGSMFVYREGYLCYENSQTIRVLNVYESEDHEAVINLPSLMKKMEVPITPNHRILHYQDNIVTFICDFDGEFLGTEAWLVVVDLRNLTADENRVLLREFVPLSQRLFARNDARYLYYGTHTGTGSHGHNEWIVRSYDLTKNARIINSDLQLSNFVGSELGVTVTFEVYQGYFYAVSNQTSFDVEEVDWTSYYHCYRFPLGEPHLESMEVISIWRRQHREGPINDSWTDLALHPDEQSGNLMIMECRREWLDGSSAQKRTYYTQPLNFEESLKVLDISMDATLTAGPSINTPRNLPLNDVLVGTLDESSTPHWEPPHFRLPRNVHPEFECEALPASSGPSFLLSKTKFRTYNHSCSTFLDLVVDDRSTLTPQLRLRVGTRKVKSPLIDDPCDPSAHGMLNRPIKDPITDLSIDGSEERFVDQGIKMWPPIDAPTELLDILQPGRGSTTYYIGDVHAASGERSLIYSVSGSIILINFDLGIRFSVDEHVDGNPVIADLDEGSSTRKGKGRADGEEMNADSGEAPWFRRERAQWVDINQIWHSK